MHPLVKILLPLAGIAFVFVVFGRRPNFKEDIGWKVPALHLALIWILVAAVYILATDAVIHWRGPWDWEPWRTASVVTSVLRVVAIVFLGPVGEELIMRGLLQSRLARRVSPALAVLLTAILWAALHVDYSIGIRVVLVGFGLILGLARLKTGSILTAIAMHWVWNGYAIW